MQPIVTNLMKILSQPQKFGIKACLLFLLLLCYATTFYVMVRALASGFVKNTYFNT